MGLLDLILDNPTVWAFFSLYLIATSWLAWQGHKKTGDITDFAVGSGDMNPYMVGITLAASVTSTATFLINPGFVYVHGVAALMHFGVAAALGIIIGLFIMSFSFRRIGQQVKAVTLPQWIGERYQSRAMTIFFAAVNMMLLTFMVLIVGSIAIAMQKTMGLSQIQSLVLIIGFVFSYIFVGGTYAHAYTNTLQGGIMVVIAAIIVASGLHHFSSGVTPVLDQLASVDPNLATTINPKSPLYNTFFSVWVSGFLIGFAVICQPHILNKALYVESDRAVFKYLVTCVLVSIVFTALLLVGLYAHLGDIPPEAFLNAETGKVAQDDVVVTYIRESFSPFMVAIIIVALMAAGMSTLDGILIALSSIAANDLFLNLTRDNLLRDKTEPERLRAAHRAGQIILVIIGVTLFLIMAFDPPKLLGIFGQIGVYGVVACSLAPIFCGLFFKHINKYAVFLSAIVALVVHVGLYIWGRHALDLFKQGSASGDMAPFKAFLTTLDPVSFLLDSQGFVFGFANPGVTATYGIIASFCIALPAGFYALIRPPADAPDDAPTE